MDDDFNVITDKLILNDKDVKGSKLFLFKLPKDVSQKSVSIIIRKNI